MRFSNISSLLLLSASALASNGILNASAAVMNEYQLRGSRSAVNGFNIRQRRSLEEDRGGKDDTNQEQDDDRNSVNEADYIVATNHRRQMKYIVEASVMTLLIFNVVVTATMFVKPKERQKCVQIRDTTNVGDSSNNSNIPQNPSQSDQIKKKTSWLCVFSAFRKKKRRIKDKDKQKKLLTSNKKYLI